MSVKLYRSNWELHRKSSKGEHLSARFFKELLRIHNVQVRESQILIVDKEIENKLKN